MSGALEPTSLGVSGRHPFPNLPWASPKRWECGFLGCRSRTCTALPPSRPPTSEARSAAPVAALLGLEPRAEPGGSCGVETPTTSEPDSTIDPHALPELDGLGVVCCCGCPWLHRS